jgi:hypothetical protein
MNPGSPTLTTRPNTSAAIMRAAKALEEKARESLPTSSYTTNPMPPRSSERSLVKGNQHKRMQSLQPSGIRDLRSYLDTHKSPERSPERPKTRDGARSRESDYFGKELDARFDQFGRSPSAYDLGHAPTTRPSHRAFLGENTPPSATMKALQTMTIPPHILDPSSERHQLLHTHSGTFAAYGLHIYTTAQHHKHRVKPAKGHVAAQSPK